MFKENLKTQSLYIYEKFYYLGEQNSYQNIMTLFTYSKFN